MKQSRTVQAGEQFISESEDVRQVRDPGGVSESHALPVASNNPSANSPMSETGLVAPVKLAKEGSENDERQDAPRAIGETQPAEAVTADKPTILLIEDTIELAEVIQAALSRTHTRILHESHGGRALSRYTDLKPHLILLDIGLPDISGWQFLEGIKERHKAMNTQLPLVIVITAFGDPANRLVGKFQGVFDYLIKPFTAAEVERVVLKALASRSE
jgi:CheY-like chemotaxis protein